MHGHCKDIAILPSSKQHGGTVNRKHGDDPNRLDNNLISIVPENPLQPYDMKEIIHSIVDNHQFFEVHELFAPNVIVGFCRLHGRTVGIVANQPMVLAGALDIDSSNKASRFVRFCDCYNIPIITLVDTPGYMPGTQQEHGGIIRHGSKLLYAYCEATVPKITIIIGKHTEEHISQWEAKILERT